MDGDRFHTPRLHRLLLQDGGVSPEKASGMWRALSYDSLGKADAFDTWRSIVFPGVDARPVEPATDAGFHAAAAVLMAGRLEFWRYRSGPIEVHRSIASCRADDGDQINLTLMRSGRAVIEQNGSVTMNAGDIGWFDMARPLRSRWEGHSDINLMIPRDTARRVLGSLDACRG